MTLGSGDPPPATKKLEEHSCKPQCASDRCRTRPANRTCHPKKPPESSTEVGDGMIVSDPNPNHHFQWQTYAGGIMIYPEI